MNPSVYLRVVSGMNTCRTNLPMSRLPGPRRAIPVPSSTSGATKRLREETTSLAAPVKKRKISEDRSRPTAPPVLSTRNANATGVRSGTTRAAKPIGATTRNTASVKPRTANNATKTTARANAGGAKSASAAAPASKTTQGGGKKSRPAWDLKGRLQDMEEAMKEMSHQFSSAKAKNEKGDQQIEALASDKENLFQEYESCKKVIADLKTTLGERDDDIQRTKRTLAGVEEDKARLQRSLNTLQDDFDAAQAQIRGLKCSVAEQSAAMEGIKAQNDVLKSNLDASETLSRERALTIETRDATIRDLQALIQSQEGKIRGFETERRVLHNTIQELKGNIRVFCRVRPLLSAELTTSDHIDHMGFPDGGKTLEIARLSDIGVNETLSANRKGSKFEFKYDKVFDPESTQSVVFEEISQLVQSSLDGYNVCIFAYGQTGSGKTYTMEGGAETESEGMIPRSVALVFSFVETLKGQGWTYAFEASFFEIYNETIRDLLGDDGHSNDKKHEIKMKAAKSDEVYVTNLTTVNVTECAQVHALLRKAGENRAVAETKCNARSSRSHSVFRMRIEGSNAHTGEKCVGLLNLIDLAGSERVKDSGSEGARLKEAAAIVFI